eukprot:TRINITY_DN5629_c1_g2_i1.p1 TRINITY_DN5629_c1_g2~~TRINITY_DN5629_c1_g2_i1.p1  ORF type:complete len:448 (-),score=66.82 TRINITY_DN5629_c1_g2_i1:143-1486(-)
MEMFAPSSLKKESLSVFAKASKEYRGHLNAAPMTLSYEEAFFGGLGIRCPKRPPDAPAQTMMERYSECCPGFFSDRACLQVFEMICNALGWSRHGSSQEKQDLYYTDMSEAFSFHHFTPSILLTSDQHPIMEGTSKALRLNPGIAKALTRVPEPKLGIVWADSLEDGLYTSQKYHYTALFLTTLLDSMRQHGDTGEIDFIEIGAGFGAVPRMIAAARKDLDKEGIRIRSFSIFDMRSIINLQRWYLNRTLGSLVELRDWIDEPLPLEDAPTPTQSGRPLPYNLAKQPRDSWNARLTNQRSDWGSKAGSAATKIWPEILGVWSPDAPLRVDFVDQNQRDLFVNLFGSAHATEESAKGRRAHRVLYACNSWHEFVMSDFMWYYNHLVAAPTWQMGVDWIVYVSNRGWYQNDAKEALLLEPREHYGFDVVHESCSPETCVRVLRRQNQKK